MGGPHRYGVVLDAGSSGTRLHIYRWKEHEHARSEANKDELSQLPVIKTKKHWAKKVKPGVSTFGSKPYDVGEYLAPLLQHAKENIPAELIPDTPLFLLATAGVRLLPPKEQDLLLAQICSYFRRHSNFLLPDCDIHVEVISGETEGLYGWIAANYLLGGFDDTIGQDHGGGHHTYGFLDMGGASAQIAFAPNATEAEKHADDLKLLRLRTLDGRSQEHLVFVTTWLGFGVNEARATYVKQLVDASGGPGIKELPDPCLPKGVTTTLEGKDDLSKKVNSGDPVLVGTGLFKECLRQTYPLLQKDVPCSDSPCLLKGIHVPGIDFGTNHFVGVSEFWHTTNEIFAFGDDHPYDYTKYQAKVEEFCSQDWKDIEKSVEEGKWGQKVDKEKARQVCFKASWLTNIMHNGIGIPRVGIDPIETHNSTDVGSHSEDKGFMDPFHAVEKINGVELTWTLGKILLYATWQIPAALGPSGTKTVEPVGFGPNTRDGKPTDWQYPGSAQHTTVNGTYEPGNLRNQDFPQPQSHSFRGFFFLVLIVGICCFLLACRDRRIRLYHSFNKLRKTTQKRFFGGSRRGRYGLIGSGSIGTFRRKGGFGVGIGYDRLMEEGHNHSIPSVVVDPDDFELATGTASDELDSFSDSSSAGSLGKSKNGGAWGDMGLGEERMLRAAKPKGKRWPSTTVTAAGSTGLMVRTDSRERLTRSRDVSPTGLRRSPLPR